MILGIGTDIVNCERIAKTLESQSDKFIQRIFTETEQEYAITKKDERTRIGTYAKRFAAKEACAKALGTGIAGGMVFKDVGVEHDENGAPYIVLTGAAKTALEALTPEGYAAHINLSLSDDWPIAQAFVVISAQKR